MREQVINIIKRVTGYDEISEGTDLLEEDILDSLAFIELITELEDTFNIEIQPTQIPSDTWRSIDGIVKLVESRIN
ncbi:MAG: D-alanine--poly(phosphoribitol) ligase subunit 2 [Clostridia bacterium]|nr:D-alanine--poly(phosphoribitol) ligase subunit 2 [Clostridia bacterium]